MNRIEDIYNLDLLRSSTIKTISSFSIEDLLVDDDRYEVFVDTISSGASGINMPEEIAGVFGMTMLSKSFEIVNDNSANKTTKRYEIAKDEVEFAWETIERWANKLAGELNKKVVLDGYPNGRYYFGHLEADGTYGLFYVWDKKE